MDTREIESIWAASDYGPTARRLEPVGVVLARRVDALTPGRATIADIGAGHGSLTALLVDRGHEVLAVEPTAVMRSVGERVAPGARWSAGSGEETGLPDRSVDVVVSSFGWMFAEPTGAVAEAARILRPGGTLLFTAWSKRGFLSDMTDRMMAAVGAPADPPHMLWCVADVARERLAPHFGDIIVEDHDLPWCFDDVAEGMRLYREGSPTHAVSLARAGDRAPRLLAALEDHLRETADPSGRITSTTGYVVVEARAR